MKLLKTPLEICLWTIGILLGIATLLFILSYFVFYFLFSSAPQDWALRGVQLQDKPYLAGIDDLSPNAFVLQQPEKMRQIMLLRSIIHILSGAIFV